MAASADNRGMDAFNPQSARYNLACALRRERQWYLAMLVENGAQAYNARERGILQAAIATLTPEQQADLPLVLGRMAGVQ